MPSAILSITPPTTGSQRFIGSGLYIEDGSASSLKPQACSLEPSRRCDPLPCPDLRQIESSTAAKSRLPRRKSRDRQTFPSASAVPELFFAAINDFQPPRPWHTLCCITARNDFESRFQSERLSTQGGCDEGNESAGAAAVLAGMTAFGLGLSSARLEAKGKGNG